MGTKQASTDDTMEFADPADQLADIKPKSHRKTKAALAAGAVASTVAATAAYRRRTARHHLGNAR